MALSGGGNYCICPYLVNSFVGNAVNILNGVHKTFGIMKKPGFTIGEPGLFEWL